MTKLFLTQPLSTDTAKKDDGAAIKVPSEIFTVFQTPKLPVAETSEPTVKREKKTRTTWLIGLIFIIWLFAIFVIIIHFAPGCIYKNLHPFSENEIRRLSLDKYIIEPATPDIRLAQSVFALKLVADKPEEPSREVSTQTDDKVPLVIGEGKVERKTDDASEAIQTLLRSPDVQHLIIIGKKDIDDEQTVKGVVVVNDFEDKLEENKEPDDEKTDELDSDVDTGLPNPTQQTFLQKEQINIGVPQQSPQTVSLPPPVPPMLPSLFPPVDLQTIMRRKMMHFLRYEMFLRAIQEMQARYAAMQTSSFHQMPIPPPLMPLIHMHPGFQNMPRYQFTQPYAFTPVQQIPYPLSYSNQYLSATSSPANVQQQQQQTIQQMQAVNNTPKKLDSPHQFPLQVEVDRQPLVPQQESDVIVGPNLPVERESSVLTIPLHKSEAKVNERDRIFKLLQARSQEIAKTEENLQQQKKSNVIEQTIQNQPDDQLNDGEIRPGINEGDIRSDLNDGEFMDQKNDDEFKSKAIDPIDVKADEQQTAMVMIEDTFPRRPAQALFGEDISSAANQNRTNSDTVDAKADEDQTSLVMIEDTFPRETNEESEETVESKLHSKEPKNASGSLAAFFRFFEQEAVKKDQNPNKKSADENDVERGRVFKQFFEEALEREKQGNLKQTEYEDVVETTVQPFDQATALYTDLQEDASGMEIELDVPEPARTFQDEKTESPKQQEVDHSARFTVENFRDTPVTFI